MITPRMRGLVIGVLLASCAALPATAQAATPTLTTTTKCLDPQAPTDQYVDVTASGLAPNTSYYPLLDLLEGPDGDFEVGYPTANLDTDATGAGSSSVWFDAATYSQYAATYGDGSGLWLKLRLNSDFGFVGELRIPVCGADTTPPVVTVPADITADATSSAGAAVSFTATATDDVDGSVPATCTPASGSTFAVGTTTVSCSASDAAGNTASADFTVTVKPDVRSMLTTGALRDAYDRFVAAGRTKNACNALNTLLNEIRARTGTQPGKALTPAQGERVTAAVRLLGAALGCR